MYELADYLAMIEDPVRTPAYLAAMRAMIRPGDHVLEIGTGVGFFAIEACRLGAAHVYAIEPNDVIALGPALAAANGCADRITFMQDRSERCSLSRRADLLVEDLRGISPLHHGRIGTLADARERLLLEGARTIPARDQLWCAPSEWPSDLSAHPADAEVVRHGVDVTVVLEMLRRRVVRTRGVAKDLLAAGQPWATLDYAAAPSADAQGTSVFIVEREGRLAGIASWFSTELVPGIGYDTGPASARTVYDRAVLPLGEPIAVRRGDRIALTLRATFDGADYVWSWEVRVEPLGDRMPIVARGSTLGANLMSAARRARRAGMYRPPVTANLEALRSVVRAVDGVRSLEEIATELARTHRAEFPDSPAALRWAAAQLAALEEGGVA